MRRYCAVLLPLALLAGCEPARKAPPSLWFEGLPVRGNVGDAHRAGFTNCVRDTQSVRCRREGVMLWGQGPYAAAVDLLYSDGSGGFYELTLWHDRDQDAVSAVSHLLAAQGWQTCRTGLDESRGDQEIYTKAGSPVRISIDLSYWGKRRLRVVPELNQPKGHCW
jgi:hypothetical protein